MGTARFFSCAVGMLLAAQTLAGCDRNTSPIVPQALNPQPGTRGALLYVSDLATSRVSIYSYPRLKLTGKLAAVKNPAGLCVDPRTGNVWVVSEASATISEFAHGGTNRIYKLDLGAGFFDACAIDANGNLAVAKYNEYDDAGALLIFKNERGKPTIYHSRKMFYYAFVGYDGSGNAFVDGEYYAELLELPAGGKKLENVTPAGLTLSPGGVQYDGTDLAVGNAKRGVIYRVSSRSIVGKTKLNGGCVVEQFFIDAERGWVIAPSSCHSKGDVLIYDYPAGGNPIKRITGFTDPFGAVVSP
jgi:hypothetical protein